jgi:hypothetical protein
LLLIDPKEGKVLDVNGREAVGAGAEYFPWSKEQFTKREDKLQKINEAYYNKQAELKEPALVDGEGNKVRVFSSDSFYSFRAFCAIVLLEATVFVLFLHAALLVSGVWQRFHNYRGWGC